MKAQQRQAKVIRKQQRAQQKAIVKQQRAAAKQQKAQQKAAAKPAVKQAVQPKAAPATQPKTGGSYSFKDRKFTYNNQFKIGKLDTSVSATTQKAKDGRTTTVTTNSKYQNNGVSYTGSSTYNNDKGKRSYGYNGGLDINKGIFTSKNTLNAQVGQTKSGSFSSKNTFNFNDKNKLQVDVSGQKSDSNKQIGGTAKYDYTGKKLTSSNTFNFNRQNGQNSGSFSSLNTYKPNDKNQIKLDVTGSKDSSNKQLSATAKYDYNGQKFQSSNTFNFNRQNGQNSGSFSSLNTYKPNDKNQFKLDVTGSKDSANKKIDVTGKYDYTGQKFQSSNTVNWNKQNGQKTFTAQSKNSFGTADGTYKGQLNVGANKVNGVKSLTVESKNNYQTKDGNFKGNADLSFTRSNGVNSFNAQSSNKYVSPNKKLELGADLSFSRVDGKNSGSVGVNGKGTFGNGNVVSGNALYTYNDGKHTGSGQLNYNNQNLGLSAGISGQVGTGMKPQANFKVGYDKTFDLKNGAKINPTLKGVAQLGGSGNSYGVEAGLGYTPKNGKVTLQLTGGIDSNNNKGLQFGIVRHF